MNSYGRIFLLSSNQCHSTNEWVHKAEECYTNIWKLNIVEQKSQGQYRILFHVHHECVTTEPLHPCNDTPPRNAIVSDIIRQQYFILFFLLFCVWCASQFIRIQHSQFTPNRIVLANIVRCIPECSEGCGFGDCIMHICVTFVCAYDVIVWPVVAQRTKCISYIGIYIEP